MHSFFFAKKTNKKFLCVSLGFSAGVMIYVSMIEMFQTAKESLVGVMGIKAGNWITVISFFAGIAIIALIDKFVPEEENPHEVRSVEEVENEIEEYKGENKEGKADIKDKTLMRTGIVTALAIAIHNFPEGLATFVSALEGASLAIPITIAIAIHNIPEGISVSVPIFYATGEKKKAFFIFFLIRYVRTNRSDNRIYFIKKYF